VRARLRLATLASLRGLGTRALAPASIAAASALSAGYHPFLALADGVGRRLAA